MTSSHPAVSPLRQLMIDNMRMRQLSPKTQANDLRIVREFSRFLGRSPNTATVADPRGYQLQTAIERKFAQTLGSITVTDLAIPMETSRRAPSSRRNTKGNRALRRLGAGCSLFFGGTRSAAERARCWAAEH